MKRLIILVMFFSAIQGLLAQDNHIPYRNMEAVTLMPCFYSILFYRINYGTDLHVLFFSHHVPFYAHFLV